MPQMSNSPPEYKPKNLHQIINVHKKSKEVFEMAHIRDTSRRDEQTLLQHAHATPSPCQQQNSPATKTVTPQSIDLQKPALMLGFLILGNVSAITHHLFYQSMDGLEAKHQDWTIRIGNGLAKLTAFSLLAVGQLSRDQWLWKTLRTRFLTLGGIDAMFGASSSMCALLNTDFLRNAKVIAAMSAVKWLFPLMAIFTPSTISVIPSKYVNTTCKVPSLDFRYKSEARDKTDWSLGNALYLTQNDTYTYLSPNGKAYALLNPAAYSGRVAPGSTKPVVSTLSGNSNTYNYAIQFEGPAVECRDVEIGDPSAPWQPLALPNCESPHDSDEMPVFQAGKINGSSTSFYALASVQGTAPGLTACRRVYGWICQSVVAKYLVEQTASNQLFLEPKITVHTLYSIMDSQAYNISSSPRNYPNQYNIPNWILFDVIGELLFGNQFLTIQANSTEVSSGSRFPSGSKINATSNVDSTTLMRSCTDPVPDLGPKIEAMVQKMVVSLLSYDNSSYYTKTEVSCSVKKGINVYRYKSLILVLTYTVAILVSSLLVVLGILAILRNGVASDTNFSTILRATRNPTLDAKVEGDCLGASPLPERLGKLELRFGVMPGTAEHNDWVPLGHKAGYGTRHVALGVRGEVTPIETMELYL